jgi:hypothetical protein
LKLSGSGAKTTIGTTTAVGVTVSAGSNFTLAGFNFTATGTTSIDGTLTVSSTTGTKIFDNLVINNGGLFNSTVNENYTMNGNLQVDGTGSINSGTGTWAFATAAVFSGTGAATITDVDINGTATNNGTYTFTNLDIDGTGTFTFTNNGTINAAAITGTGNDTYSQGAGSVLNFSGATLAISNISVAGAGNTVNYNGGTQTVRALSYQNLVLSGTNAKTVTGSTINVKLSMQGTATATGTSPTYAAAAILEYKGSGAQNTSNVEFVGTGANPTNLTIDNTNGVTLNVGKSINGALTLANGYLTTTNTNLLTINTVGSASTSNGAFVNGPLSKVKNTTALFTFPVGTLAGGLRTIGVTPTTTTSTTYRATFNTGNPKTSVGNNLGTLAEISNCEYWDLTQTSGTTPAKVTLSWPAAANSCGQAYVGNVASLVVGHFSGGAWSNEGQSAFSGTPSAGGTVTSANNLSSFSPFVLATTNASENPLPVMFADVKAFQKNSGVEVSWSNLTERDLISYTVERSSNGQTFTSVNQVAPRSNANDKESYSAFDASPIAGVNYYRVKVLEVSGKIIYSKVLKVDLSGKQTGISLYPNPVSGNQVSLSINVKQGQYTVKVLNGAGQQVYSQRLIHQGGSMTQTVELPSSVKPGVYNMMVTGDNYRESKMFVIQ